MPFQQIDVRPDDTLRKQSGLRVTPVAPLGQSTNKQSITPIPDYDFCRRSFVGNTQQPVPFPRANGVRLVGIARLSSTPRHGDAAAPTIGWTARCEPKRSHQGNSSFFKTSQNRFISFLSGTACAISLFCANGRLNAKVSEMTCRSRGPGRYKPATHLSTWYGRVSPERSASNAT